MLQRIKADRHDLLEAKEGLEGFPTEVQLQIRKQERNRSAFESERVLISPKPCLDKLRILYGCTYVVETGGDGNGNGGKSADGTTGSCAVFSLDTETGVSDTGGKEGSVGSVDEPSGGTVKFSEEDKEKGKGSRLGKVTMGTNGTLEFGNVGGTVDLLFTGTGDFVRVAGTKVDVGVETVESDVGGKVGVVACEEGRVCQRGLFVVRVGRVEK